MGLTDENIAALIWQYIFPDLMKKAKTYYMATNKRTTPIIPNPVLIDRVWGTYKPG